MTDTVLSRDQVAARIARDIPAGSYVNLGIGAPTLVSNFLPDDHDVILHTENGMLGMGPQPPSDQIDPDLVNAGKQPVTELPGASYFHQADSFGMMRGGHVDVCVLGTFEVSVGGDLANWSTGVRGAIPAVGGAMDLAIGAGQVWVMTDLLTRDGHPKIVAECTLPLTGVACVTRIYTERAIFDVTPEGLSVRDLVAGTTVADLEKLLGLSLRAGVSA